jgi:hypothetical protein
VGNILSATHRVVQVYWQHVKFEGSVRVVERNASNGKFSLWPVGKIAKRKKLTVFFNDQLLWINEVLLQ